MTETKKVAELLKLLEADWREAAEIIRELGILDLEAKNKRAKLNRLNLIIRQRMDEAGVKEFSDENKKKVFDLLQSRPLPKPDHAHLLRFQKAFEERKEVESWKAWVVLDNPRPLQIYVSFPGLKPKIIDVLASIKANVANLGHPLIARAIQRYKEIIDYQKPPKDPSSFLKQNRYPLSPNQAYGCLEEICKVLKSPEHLPGQYTEDLSKHTSLIYDWIFFEEVANFLKSPSVKIPELFQINLCI